MRSVRGESGDKTVSFKPCSYLPHRLKLLRYEYGTCTCLRLLGPSYYSISDPSVPRTPYQQLLHTLLVFYHPSCTRARPCFPPQRIIDDGSRYSRTSRRYKLQRARLPIATINNAMNDMGAHVSHDWPARFRRPCFNRRI